MFEFDVCIVGTGIGGAILAAELAPTGKRIAILEAGDFWLERSEAQDRIGEGAVKPIWAFTPTPQLHVPLSVRSDDKLLHYGYYQARKVGGNSLHWLGWSLRGLPNHFKKRTLHGIGEDWPFGYDELEPYYCRAEEELGVSGSSAPEHNFPPRSKPYPLAPLPITYVDQLFGSACDNLGVKTLPLSVARPSSPYRGRQACCFSGRCAICPTTAKYTSDVNHLQTALSHKNVTLFTNTIAAQLRKVENGTTRELLCYDPERGEKVFKAGTFVIACGTMHSTRLFLMSTGPGAETGLGNSSGVLGRHLSDHLMTEYSAFLPEEVRAHRAMSSLITRHFEDGGKEYSGFHLSIWRGPGVTDIGRSLVDEGQYGAQFKTALRKRLGGGITFNMEMEMLPRDECRMELDPAAPDGLGMPGLRITPVIGEFERNGEARARAEVGKIAASMGCTKVEVEKPKLLDLGFHAMGSMRMGRERTKNFVNPDLKVHDLNNTYVLTNAIFPNSLGAANPSLTLAALSIRLAKHLKSKVLQ